VGHSTAATSPVPDLSGGLGVPPGTATGVPAPGPHSLVPLVHQVRAPGPGPSVPACRPPSAQRGHMRPGGVAEGVPAQLGPPPWRAAGCPAAHAPHRARVALHRSSPVLGVPPPAGASGPGQDPLEVLPRQQGLPRRQGDPPSAPPRPGGSGAAPGRRARGSERLVCLLALGEGRRAAAVRLMAPVASGTPAAPPPQVQGLSPRWSANPDTGFRAHPGVPSARPARKRAPAPRRLPLGPGPLVGGAPVARQAVGREPEQEEEQEQEQPRVALQGEPPVYLLLLQETQHLGSLCQDRGRRLGGQRSRRCAPRARGSAGARGHAWGVPPGQRGQGQR